MGDVFISHATADDAIVTRIHAVLTAAGISVWVDHEDGIGPGDRWPQQIQQAAHDCRCGLFVLSPASAQSVYCEAEWNRVLQLGKCLYVALIEPVPLALYPLRLGTIQYTDLTRDFDQGMADLIRAITGQRDLDAQAASTAQIRRVSGDFPRWHLDIPLIGRDTDKATIEAMLAEDVRTVSVLGLGGIGKTRLAVAIATAAAFRDGIVWHEIRPHTAVIDLTLTLREHLKLDTTTSPDSVWAALGQKQVLLVVDNAEECSQPQAYADRLNNIDLSGGTRVLMTSRQQWRELHSAKNHELRAPDAAAAVAILRAMAAHEPPAYSLNGYEAALAEAAHDHPRLMQYAVRWADAYPPDYVLNILKTLKGGDAQEALDDMVNKTVNLVRARQGGPEAIAALRRLSVCRGGFTFDAARAIMGEGADPHSLAMLKQWGLVTLAGGRYDVDSLVTAAVRVDETAHQAHYDYYKALVEQYEQTQDYVGLAAEAANLEAAFEWAMRVGKPRDALALANASGHFLSNRGRFEQRLRWFERVATALAVQPDKALWADAQNSLGIAYQEHPTGDRAANLRQAIHTYDQALTYRTPDANPLAYATTQNNLGNAYVALAEVTDRQTNLYRAIDAFTEALRYRTPTTAPLAYAATQTNVGNAYRALAEIEARTENLQRASAAYGAALRFFTSQTAPLYYAMIQNNLGAVHRDLADVNERDSHLKAAIAAFTEALHYLTAQTAPSHYAMIQNNLGATYRDLASIEAQAENLRHAQDAFAEALRFHTPQADPLGYAMTQANLGLAHKMAGDTSAAIMCWREAELHYRSMGLIDDAEQMVQWITEIDTP